MRLFGKIVKNENMGSGVTLANKEMYYKRN